MIQAWKAILRVGPAEAALSVSTAETGPILRARLPLAPHHPRALLTTLEGLALWSGEPLSVVISADDSSRHGYASGLFGDELWPSESLLVRYDVVARGPRAARLRSLARPAQAAGSPRSDR